MEGDTIKHIRIQALVLFSLFLFFSIAEARHGITLTGKVMRVKDGDTIVISPEDGGQFLTCRLYGIDAPETPCGRKSGQRYGKESGKELKRLILGDLVNVTTTGQKTYNREVCIIKKEGQDINLEMVKRGYAWAYRQYLRSPYASEYIDAERTARARGLGLWNDRNPMPPWEFRRMMR